MTKVKNWLSAKTLVRSDALTMTKQLPNSDKPTMHWLQADQYKKDTSRRITWAPNSISMEQDASCKLLSVDINILI